MTGRQGSGRDRPSASNHGRDRPNRANQSGQRLPPQEDQEMSGTGPSLRSNEYFVPRDGIDREVITADICRYLGNDALVRPGTYETKDGRTEQGYFIIAYRNLTSAMIQDLKADSARWEQERRSQPTRTTPGGAPSGAQFQGPGYRASETHQHRQYYGPTGAEPQYGGDAMAIDPYSSAPPPAPRYPGTGNHGYTGASGGGAYPPQQPQYQSQQGYPPQPSAAYSGPVSAQYPSEPSRYQESGFGSQAFSSHPGAAPSGFGSHPTAAPQPQVGYVTGSNMPVNPGLVSGPYMDYSRPGLPQGTSPSAGPGAYPTSGARQQTYQSTADPGSSYYPSVPMAQPLDVAYGRGPGTGAYTTATASDQETTSDYTVSPSAGPPQAAYGTVPAASEYEEVPPPSLASGQSTSASTQGLSSGTTRRETPRDRERGGERETHRRDRERTGEQDRDSDRHASERHERRSHRTRQ